LVLGTGVLVLGSGVLLVLGTGVLVLGFGIFVLGTGNPPRGGVEARGFFTAVAEDWIRVDSRLGQPTVSSLKVSSSWRWGRFLRLNVSCCRGGGRLPEKKRVKQCAASVSMRIRIQLFISMRIQIRIQEAKPMRIHADTDPG
jgi:hypothetical protein